MEHEIHVRKVLERLRSAGLQAALHKCEFHVTRTRFLGFILTPNGIEVDQEKIKAIIEWAVPTTVFGVRSFLGFCGFYRKFIKDYSKIVKPLNLLTKAGSTFQMDYGVSGSLQQAEEVSHRSTGVMSLSPRTAFAIGDGCIRRGRSSSVFSAPERRAMASSCLLLKEHDTG